jgi:uncharacterized lipoprotein YmbA
VRFMPCCLAVLLIFTGCATRRADHFYALSALPGAPSASRAVFARQVTMHITLPSLVDRGELIFTTGDQVTILEHERWASPLLDQVIATLGQDLEARRAELLIANRSLEQSTMPLSKVSVEVVRISAERGARVTLETRWRVVDSVTGNVAVGRDVFAAPMASEDYAQLAAALSQCLAQLADKLIAVLPAAQG